MEAIRGMSNRDTVNTLDDKVIFQSNSDMISVQSLYCTGGYVTYEVSCSTCGFSGTCNFCIGEGRLKEYIQMMDSMIDTLSGELEIQDCESDAFLKFYFENKVSFYVVGQIGGSYEDNTLRFRLEADQTVLYGLKRNLLDYDGGER